MKLRSVWKGAVLVTVSALLIAAVTLLGLLAFIWYNSDGGQDWSAPVSEISDALLWDGTAYRFTGETLLEEERWAMLLNEQGQVVWSLRKPAEIPNVYTISQVASFTRWYLKDYPVQCRVRSDGLLVVGSPKGSVWKHDIAMDVDVLLQTPIWFLSLFLLALGGVLSFSYLTVRRWFRQAQQVRDAARSNWINGVSHDIRTPLSVVMGYAAQLEQAELSQDQKSQAAAIRVQSQIIRDLVNDLNLTMRLDCEMQALRKETLQPEVFLRQIAADFLNGGLAEGFGFVMDLPETALPQMQGDPFLLRRAMSNLLTNCVRHNSPGGTIRLGACLEGKMLVLFVEGGTAEGSRPVDAACQLEADGGAAHGTGLRLVAQIAAAHGGTAKFSADEIVRCEIGLPIQNPENRRRFP